MKKMKFLALLTILLGLTGCNNNKEEEKELTEYDKTVYVCFYIDYNRVDIADPYVGFMWYPGELLPLDQVPDISKEECPDGFSQFVGWSTHTIIDDKEDLWDFNEDVVPTGVNGLNLFGIWLAAGE